jgi:hypothetical protein
MRSWTTWSKVEDGGREVQFWQVPRQVNREADALADRALDEL